MEVGTMIISAKLIKNPRKERDCDNCRRVITGSQLRLYGSAETGDKPYILFVHPFPKSENFTCYHMDRSDPKIQKALEKRRK